MVSQKKTFRVVFAAFAVALTVLFVGCSDPEPEVEIEQVVFTPASGTYDVGTEITLSCPTKNVVIYYSVEKKLYPSKYRTGTKGKKVVLEDCKEGYTIWAVAVDKNGNTSKSVSAVYNVNSDEAENSALYLGNPSKAVTDVANEENYLLRKSTYAISYNNITHNPNWVSWHLVASDLSSNDRNDSFSKDPDLPDNWYKVTDTDYRFSTYGFDRGHMCPNSHRNPATDDAEADKVINQSVFKMTNMVPQSPVNNQQVWNSLESVESKWARNGKELYIICGPYGKGGTSDKGAFDYIAISNPKKADDPGIVVPASVWRVVIVLDEAGENDLSRIDENTKVIAINVPNTKDCASDAKAAGLDQPDYWKHYITTIDAIEEMTGYDFFSYLPNSIEDVLEARKYSE